MFLQKKIEPGQEEKEKVVEIIDLATEDPFETKEEEIHLELNQKSLEEELIQNSKRFLYVKLVHFGKIIKERHSHKEDVAELEKKMNELLEVLSVTNLSVLVQSIPSLSRIILELSLKILTNTIKDKPTVKELIEKCQGCEIYFQMKFVQMMTNKMLHHNDAVPDVYDMINLILAIIRVVFYTVEEMK